MKLFYVLNKNANAIKRSKIPNLYVFEPLLS